jgi:hypothetical protein
MRLPQETSSDAAARLLALMVATRGQIVPRDMGILDRHDALNRLGIRRDRFLELAKDSLGAMAGAQFECSWLQANDQAYVDRLVGLVTDVQQRDLVCRLATAVVMADGNPPHDDRLVYHHALSHWRLDQAALADVPRHEGASHSNGRE